MTTEEIYQALLQYFPQLAMYTWIPAVISVGAVIFMILKGINEIRRSCSSVSSNVDEVKELRQEVKALKEISYNQVEDYNKMMTKMNKLIEKDTKVHEKD